MQHCDGVDDNNIMLQIFFIGMLRDMAWRVKLPKHESTLVRTVAATSTRKRYILCMRPAIA